MSRALDSEESITKILWKLMSKPKSLEYGVNNTAHKDWASFEETGGGGGDFRCISWVVCKNANCLGIYK